jgi:hypothetical protein
MEENKDTQPPKTPPPPIIDQLVEYAETRVKLAKYQAIEGGTSIAASIIADVVVIICSAMAFIFASITLAYYLGRVFGAEWEGFGTVAIIYILIAIIVKYNKKGLERPIINALIQKILK